jgi:hypothetical protein
MALVNKGVALAAPNRSDEKVAVYDSVISRVGEAAEPALREQVDKAGRCRKMTLDARRRRKK